MDNKKKYMVPIKQNAILFLCSAVFVLLSGKKFLPMDGIPFNSLLEILVLIILFLLFFIFPFKKIEQKLLRKYAAFFICLALVKATIGLITPSNGLYAKYFANPSWEGQHERSTEFAGLKNATRIDGSIDFQNIGYSFSGNPFPLYFLNDSKRFNYYSELAHLRINPPFSAEWNGYIFIPENMKYGFEIISGDKVWMFIDGNEFLTEREGLKNIYLSKGSHTVKIKISHYTKGPKYLTLKSSLTSDTTSVIQSRFFYLNPVSLFEHRINSFLIYAHYLLITIWALSIGFIGRMHLERLGISLMRREKFYLSLMFLASFALRVFSNIKRWKDPQAMILAGGDDWLSYETAARSIILDDFLNAAFEEGRPFGLTPLYRYFLSLFHFLTGENPFFAVILQGVMLGLTVVLTYYLGKKLFSASVGIVSSVLLIAVDMMPRMFDRFLGEPTAAFFALAFFVLLLKFSEKKEGLHLFLSGILFGLAVGIRPNLFPFLLVIITWIFASKIGFKTAIKNSAFFVLPIMLIIASIALRNYIVSDNLVLFSAGGPTALLVGNPVPSDIILKPIERPYFDKLSIAPQTRIVIEFMLQAPEVFFSNIMKKLFFLFGITQPSIGEGELRVLLPNIIAVFGMLLSFVNTGRQVIFNRLLAIMFITCNMVIMAIIVVNQYGYRFTIPVFPFVYAFAAYAIVLSGDFILSNVIKKRS